MSCYRHQASSGAACERIVGALAVIALTGCATVGPAVPELSGRVGDRLAEMRSLHEHAIRRMFEGERRRLDAFVDLRWTPAFLRNYVGNSDILSTVSARRTISEERESDVTGALKGYLPNDTTEASRAARAVVAAIESDRVTEPATIRRELTKYVDDKQLDAATRHVIALLGTDDPARELIEWARHTEREIQRQRRTLHAPIDSAEDHTLAELDSAYDKLVTAQAALTARMQKAANLKQLQDDALRSVGLDTAFARVKAGALTTGAGVGRALERLEALEDAELLKGTKPAQVLREALRVSAPPSGNFTKQ